MSINIVLPEPLAGELSAEASRLGLPLPEYIVRVLRASQAVAKGNSPTVESSGLTNSTDAPARVDDDETARRADAVRAVDVLRARLAATYNAVADSTELIRQDRAR